MREPGRSALVLGPSGSGKSHLLASALEAEGSGVILMAMGLDEVESYRRFYPEAEIVATQADVERVVQKDDAGNAFIASEKPYLLAAFDDDDFYPSLGQWKAKGLENAVQWLRLVYAALAKQPSDQEPRWKVLGVDTYTGFGELAGNAMSGKLKFISPPKARGEGGAEYYVGYRNKLIEFSRACRAIRGFGCHWLATAHVQMREASDTYTGQDVSAKEQQMAMFTGAFREQVPSFFDLVLYTGVSSNGKHYAQWQADKFRHSKSRYVMDPAALDAKGRLENDWPTISKAILST